jgi:formylglycine-generating enzyme required for sulfatase activity
LAVGATGSRSACVSDVGAFDMVGNLWEWVAEWGDFANGCASWSGNFGSDISCVGGPGSPTSNLPAGMTRGGSWDSHAPFAGVFAVNVFNDPSSPFGFVGFRCAR